MTNAAKDEINFSLEKLRRKETPKALPESKQKLFNQLNAAQFTIEYPYVLNKVRRELGC